MGRGDFCPPQHQINHLQFLNILFTDDDDDDNDDESAL